MEKEVYILGHKNPDTDSISAALAYANLKNSLGQGAYKAGRIGEINKETEFVLNYFGVEKPMLVHSVGSLVEDAMSEEVYMIEQDTPLWEVSKLINETSTRFICVVNRQKHLQGVITVSDLAKRYLQELTMERFREIPLPVENILRTLKGKLLVDSGIEELQGNVLIGAMHAQTMVHYIKKGDILITGDRETAQKKALAAGVACLIVTGGTLVSDFIQQLAKEKKAMIISTPFDTFAAGRLVNMSIPVKKLMSKRVITFHPHELLRDVKKVMVEKKYRSYPVINENGHLLGVISPEDFLRADRKKVILVDHNERSQTVDGLNEAELLEVVDHHRLGDIQTGDPIYFRNEPVGSTSTIVATMYEGLGVNISKEMAGIMLAAILSDTLMFRSPTCTPKDEQVAERLAALAGVDIESFARQMFKAGSNFQDQSVQEIVKQDFKEFNLGKARIGVGQVSALDFTVLAEKREELLQVLTELKQREGYCLVALMLTNIIEQGTELIFLGDQEIIEEAYESEVINNSVYLEGVVSRKKQIVPCLAKVFNEQ